MTLFSYIIKELIFPFILATGVISSILMMDQIYKFIPFFKASGVEIKVLFLMVIFSMPTILMIASPISLMIAVYVGIHRVSADSEVIAMRASGVSLAFLLKPVFSLSFLVSLFVLLQSFYLSPTGVSQLEDLKFNILKNQTKINLSVQKVTNFFDQKMIYIFDQQDDEYKDLFITDWDQHEGSSVIEAKSGVIHFDENNKKIFFIMENGKIHSTQNPNRFRLVHFNRLQYDLASPDTDKSRLPTRYQNSGETKNKLDLEMTQGELYENITRVKDSNKKAYLEYVDEFHGRIVTVLSCFSFAIFALPMGIIDPRNPKTAKFVSMIVMMIIYYSIFSKARSMFVDGKAYAISLYFPLLLAIAIGYINFYKIYHDLSSYREWFLIKIRKNKN
ncbi:MAG: LptF/LptG family permease [Deltaproteobacteria bacterium]|nr:LptF/LptG family permease [Deltaproteobacteria bacterium]